MKLYMAYSHEAGPEEGAALVVAKNSREAKKLAAPIINDWFSLGWIDCRVKLIRDDYTWALVNPENRDTPHVIETPQCCEDCECWGISVEFDEENNNWFCEQCEGYPGDKLVDMYQRFYEEKKESL